VPKRIKSYRSSNQIPQGLPYSFWQACFSASAFASVSAPAAPSIGRTRVSHGRTVLHQPIEAQVIQSIVPQPSPIKKSPYPEQPRREADLRLRCAIPPSSNMNSKKHANGACRHSPPLEMSGSKTHLPMSVGRGAIPAGIGTWCSPRSSSTLPGMTQWPGCRQ
jgi:hypothetical protein